MLPARRYHPSMANRDPNPSECAKGNVHAKPKAGDAVLFHSFFHNGVRSTHEVLLGWVTKRLRTGRGANRQQHHHISQQRAANGPAM